MPGVQRWTIEELSQAVDLALNANIPAIGLFPVVSESKKDPYGKEATKHDNIICQAIRRVKELAPSLGVVVDAALDPYTTHRHDGILKGNSVDNDGSLEILCQQALVCAEAGADIISPSDMMDGRVGAIRQFLDSKGHKDVGIMSYAAKYNSAFYGPFRDILGSKSQTDRVGVSKLKYLDIEEGADSVMVKPGLPYLDIVRRIKETFHVPTFVYHISGEYAMLNAAAQKGWLDYDQALLECMIAFKRAGANGCHINPAISLGMLLTGNIKLPAFGGYVLAQLVGALIAGFVLVQIANGAPTFDSSQGFASNGFGEYSPGGYSFVACTITEIALTALLMVTVLATTKKSFAPGFGGLAVGIALVIIHLLAIPITNASVNPARSLGVAFFAEGWAMEQLWFFFAMPALGAILGVILHKIVWCSEE
ncbi:Delta-aminolevulinic acid dehydratase [Stylophora pistillata]|uniref:Delta-aminolevulinic acid dehydratase n=1 Tax=Stylophora pistillata TaxID=50429 RepID=A0A2B4R0R2_STYPI|nr:Delta-aminolevulinic acid dehydratase [Stylophora pistillata]